MTLDTVTRAKLLWARLLKPKGGRLLSEQRISDLTGYVNQMWVWVSSSSNRAAWPGIPEAPRDARMVIAPAPPRTSPGNAPSWADQDAVIRQARKHKRAPRMWIALSIQRFTGLRRSQASALRKRHVHPSRGTVRIAEGCKSKREKAEMREIPVSPHLMRILMPLYEACGGEDDYLLPARHKRGFYAPDSTVVGEAIKEAVAAKETDFECWYPPMKLKGRPSHGFRGGFMAELEDLEVADRVIDALTGHAFRDTRGRSYTGARSLMRRMRAAVDLIEDIDWDGPDERPVLDNVVSIRRDSVSR
jgi:integrase